MNEKLKKLGIELPKLPMTSVGSFPKTEKLRRARAAWTKGEMNAKELASLEREATAHWIRFQEEIGIDVLVDGEMYRGDMVAYFAEQLPGFSQGGYVRSYGNRYYRKPIVTAEVQWTKPITVEWWQYAQSLTKKPVKGMLTGPYTIMDWSFNEYYADRRATCLALARVIRAEVEALVAAGAKIIQVDEPATSVRPLELPLVIEAMDVVTRDIPAYFITHICYGEFEKIYPKMLDIPVDNFDLELSNSNNDLLPKFRKASFYKDLSAGVVDVHTHKLEPAEVVQARLAEITAVVPVEQIWVDPDCGLKTRTPEEAQDKLRRIAEVVKEVRPTYA